jgi:hypothetical protein
MRASQLMDSSCVTRDDFGSFVEVARKEEL